MSELSKTFCPLPWKEIAATPNGSLRLCCASDSKENISHYSNGSVAKIYDDLERSYNTDLFLETRKKMLKGDEVAACNSCYQQESLGLQSVRQHHLQNFSHEDFTSLTTKSNLSEITQLDLRLGKVCNLQCRMCGPYSSSSWETSWRKLGDLVIQPSEKSWDTIRNNDWAEDPVTWDNLKKLVPKLKKVYLTGGEPFLISSNKSFLKYCVEAGYSKNIELRYNTNGTIWDSELLEYWPHFKKVKLQFSVDALAEVNDYIRFPSRWSQIINNVEAAQKASQSMPLEIVLNTTAQAYNVFQIADLIDYFRKRNLYTYIGMLHNPSYLSVSVLSPELAKEAREILRREIDYPGVSNVIHMLNSSLHNKWDHFVAYTKKLDAINNQNVSKTIPELGI